LLLVDEPMIRLLGFCFFILVCSSIYFDTRNIPLVEIVLNNFTVEEFTFEVDFCESFVEQNVFRVFYLVSTFFF